MSGSFKCDESGRLWAEQHPAAVLDYRLDWGCLISPGDKIVGSSWTASGGINVSGTGFDDSSTVVMVSGGAPGEWYTLTNIVSTEQGRTDVAEVLVYIKPGSSAPGSALFPNPAVAIAKLRRDRITMAANSIMPGIGLSDDFLWDKLLAAEAELQHTLRVPLRPTRFFPRQPTPEQLAELGDMPWEIESAPDYEAEMFAGDRWGYIVTRQKPIIEVHGMRFVYPTEANGYFDIPVQWLSLDRKYGHIRIVPTSNAILTSMAGLVMMNLAGGRTIPSMVHVDYTAGLTDVQRNWPELLDIAQKIAVLKIVEDAFLPQSGSISADGMSESISVDTGKYREAVDEALNGHNGNGGLMAKLHGIRAMAL